MCFFLFSPLWLVSVGDHRKTPINSAIPERIQEKWVPVFRPNARQNKDLEHAGNPIFCQRALKPKVRADKSR